MHSESPDSDPIFESTDSVNDAERKAIIQIRKLKSHIKVPYINYKCVILYL